MASFAELQAAKPTRSASGPITRTPDEYVVRGGVTPAYKQSDRTGEQIFVLQRELEDPELNDEDREGIERELARLGGAPAEPKAKAAPVSFSELAGTPATPKGEPKAPEPRSELSIQLGGIGAGARAVSNEAATLADMLLNTPTSIVGIGANVARRLGGIIKGEDRKTTAMEARHLQERIEATAPDLAKKFVRLFPVPPGTPEEQASHVEKAMGAVMEWTDRDAAAAEERSGGAVKKEDVQLWRDTALAMLGMKGFTAPTKAAVKRAGEKVVAEARPPLELEPTIAPEAVKPEAAPTTVSFADIIDQSTGVTDVAARTTPKAHKARQEEIAGAFKEDPAYADYFRNLIEEELRVKNAEATRPARLAEAEGVKAPRTGSADPVLLTPEGQIDTGVIGQRSLDTGLDKIAKGQDFNLTATEKIAIRDNAKQWGNRIQEGKIDPELLKLMGSAGAGAVIGAYLLGDADITGAALGAAGGLLGRYGASRIPQIRQMAESVGHGLEDAAGLVSTRVKNISEPLHHRLIEHERTIFRDAHRDLNTVTPFIETLAKVPDAVRKDLEAAILTNDPIAIRNEMRKARVPGLLNNWLDVRKLLDDHGKTSQDLGILRGLRDDYFPRVVKDVEGLLNHLGLEKRTFLEKKLREAETRAMQSTGQPLTPEARSEIINKELAGGIPEGSGKGSFRKQRSIADVTKDLLPYYESPIDSLTRYIRSSAQAQAKARFFGKDALGSLDDSIGALVERELAGKNVDFKQVEELKSLLRSRFGAGERAPSAAVQDVKNLGYTALLGHPTSALVQLSDVGTTMSTQGLVPALSAVVRQLRGKGVSAKDFGLLDHIAEELTSARATAKLLDGTLKIVGFTAIDRFGKNNALTAALIRHQKLAKTPKGQADIVARYGEAFGKDTPQLIQDLAAKRNTDLVDSLLFHELSRQQPISKIEVPKAYLDNPNARVVYMLKTFMLKQMDLARRDGYNEIRKGNITKGVKNLLGLALIWGTAGATNGWVRDFIMGKEVDPQASDVWEGMFKTFGWSSYVLDKAEKGQPVQAALGTVTPPIQPLDDIARTSMKLAGDDEMKTTDWRGVQHIPVVGRLAYNHLLGGAEHSDKQKKKREKAAAKKAAKKEKEK